MSASQDKYLVSMMKPDGFVAVDVIAKFKLVQALSPSADYIVEAIRSSEQLEVWHEHDFSVI